MNKNRVLPLSLLTLILLTVLFVVPVASAQDSQPPVAEPIAVVDEDNPVSGVVSLLDDSDLKRTGIVLFLVIGNWLAASLVAISQSRFDSKKIPDFFVRTLLPFVGGLILFQAAIHVLSPASLLEAFGADVSAQFASTFDAGFLWIAFGSILVSVAVSFVKNITALISVVSIGAQKLANIGKGASAPAE